MKISLNLKIISGLTDIKVSVKKSKVINQKEAQNFVYFTKVFYIYIYVFQILTVKQMYQIFIEQTLINQMNRCEKETAFYFKK